MPERPVYRWTFEPPAHLTNLKHPTPNKLESIRRTISHVDLEDNSELSREHLGRVHEIIRRQLPPRPTGRDLKKHKEELDGAIELAKIGIKGIHFMPARVNSSAVFEDPSSQGILTVEFKHPELPRLVNLTMTMYLTRLPENPNHFIVEAYGLQHSSPRSDVPKGLHHVYDRGAPTLGLALALEALRRGGAEKVFLPTVEYEQFRRGYKGLTIAHTLSDIASKDQFPDRTRQTATQLLRDWDRLSPEQVEGAMSRDPKLKGLGFPENLIRRYYRDIPSNFWSKSVWLQHPNADRKFEFNEMDLSKTAPLGLFFHRHTSYSRL